MNTSKIVMKISMYLGLVGCFSMSGCASQGKKLEKALLTAAEISQGPCRQAVDAAADICAPVIKGMLGK